MEKILVLDSNSILNRAYYGIRFLSANDGTPTNAIYGFLNILFKLIGEEKPDYICAAFDLKAPTFRHKMYDEYKAGRSPMPDDLVVQMPIARKILQAMGVPVLEIEGYEADDIIGTVARLSDEKKIKCLIATGDKDDLQLVSDNTNVILTVSRKGVSETVCYGMDEVRERYGVTPTEFIDIKALMGDPSDNIPGVRGIGEKGAMKLISEYHSIENLFDKLNDGGITGANLKKLTEGRESAFMSKELATICCSVPIEFDFSKCRFLWDKLSENGELYLELKKLELNSLIKKISFNVTKKPKNYFEDMEITDILPEASSLSEVYMVLGFLGDELDSVGIRFDNKVFVKKNNGSKCDNLIEAIRPILEDENVKKYIFDSKEALVKLNGICHIRNMVCDIAIGAYLVNPAKNEYTISGVCEELLDVEFPADDQANSSGKQISMIEEEAKISEAEYMSVYALAPLWDEIIKKIKENNQEDLFYNVEMPLVNVLASMQIEGFTIDTEELSKFSASLQKKIDYYVNEIYSFSKEKFNLNSPKQLGVFLFEELDLPIIKKTKSGYSTNVEVLEKLKTAHPVIPMIMEYRTLTKLKSTYCDGLMSVVSKKTGKIHSAFNQTVTVTGRISSSEPNMQNIPTRTELGRELRKMFVACDDDHILIDADYSQIELRVLAHISNDPVMISAFNENEDIHSVTASQVFHVPLNEVTSSQRRFAKIVNFGIVYGMSEFSLAGDLDISMGEAKKYIKSYWEKYAGVSNYMDITKEEAKKLGYVKTMMNRIRYIPELRSPNFNIRSFGERVAQNTPIQGSAADIIKIAMVRVFNRLKASGISAKLILQVHDELIVEAKKSDSDMALKIVKEEMENAVKLSVPLTVSIAVGKTWYDAK